MNGLVARAVCTVAICCPFICNLRMERFTHLNRWPETDASGAAAAVAPVCIRYQYQPAESKCVILRPVLDGKLVALIIT